MPPWASELRNARCHAQAATRCLWPGLRVAVDTRAPRRLHEGHCQPVCSLLQGRPRWRGRRREAVRCWVLSDFQPLHPDRWRDCDARPPKAGEHVGRQLNGVRGDPVTDGGSRVNPLVAGDSCGAQALVQIGG